ncbi:glycosyltransferase family 4 protein [Kamptonema cortianum]|nr:glycosyltransferase family 4 protein [Oscillatoria laete-virens]MDK3155402.1 glycosyltransferase family 4 protein [Kamptonema cortianum]MDL5046149.1 glycosyltransferase family 4 protein [Oscillatoria amoena NRMC-F 0135]MDL5052847.1 glycosyltransferase family 4 protein [Oscillatoria laete-virens NRMC-F 0139]
MSDTLPSTTSRPRVLVVPEFDRFGGTWTVFRNTLRMLARDNFQIAVLIERRQGFREAMEEIERAGAKVFWMPERDKRWMKSWVATLYEFVAALPAFLVFRPDLIHVSCGGPGNMLGLCLYPRPLLFFLHTEPFAPLALGRNLLWRRFRRHGAIFAAVSQHMANLVVERFRIPRSNIRIVYNGCRIPETTARPDSGLIVTLGHFQEYKNPAVWLRTARIVLQRNPSAEFLWLGDGPLIETYREEIRRAGLSEKIHLPGHHPDVTKALSRARVYFHPSRMESHGIAVIEAMAHGVPCVASRVGGLKESVVEDQTGFLLDPDDVDGFADGILRLLNEPGLADRLGGEGRKRAIALFSTESWEGHIADLYRFLLNHRCGGDKSEGQPYPSRDQA